MKNEDKLPGDVCRLRHSSEVLDSWYMMNEDNAIDDCSADTKISAD